MDHRKTLRIIKAWRLAEDEARAAGLSLRITDNSKFPLEVVGKDGRTIYQVNYPEGLEAFCSGYIAAEADV